MDNKLIYSEFFDKYLKGTLSESEQLAFEEKVRQDPLLHSEIKLQKEIFAALGEARKVALKSRLDQIPLNNAGWFSMQGVRLVTAVSSALIVAVVSYIYFNNNASVKVENHVIDIDPAYTITDLIKDELSAPVPDLQEEHNQETAEIGNSHITEDITVSSNISRESPEKPDDKNVSAPEVIRPDLVTSFAEDTQAVNYQDFEAPQERIAENMAYNDASIDIENVVHHQYNFHYQFFDNKLYLYGNFEDAPYKIIALNSERGKRLFLGYNEKYYAIGDEQKEVTPLQAITDSLIIKELMRISSK